LNAEFWPELIEPGVRGLLLTGSFARGQASHFSDLDLYRFGDQERRAHSWRVLDDRLLSLTETTLEEAYERLSRPDIWPWAAGGCRVARILYDPEGEMAQLLQRPRSFRTRLGPRRAARLVRGGR
jgi:predicted nucleotidyltransferase